MIEEILVDQEVETLVEDLNDVVEDFAEPKDEESVVFEEDKHDLGFAKPKIKFGEVLFDRKTKVYVKVNNEGFITQIDSDVFLTDTMGWQVFDEGVGDRFVYAQTLYFEDSLVDENGNYRFKV